VTNEDTKNKENTSKSALLGNSSPTKTPPSLAVQYTQNILLSTVGDLVTTKSKFLEDQCKWTLSTHLFPWLTLLPNLPHKNYCSVVVIVTGIKKNLVGCKHDQYHDVNYFSNQFYPPIYYTTNTFPNGICCWPIYLFFGKRGIPGTWHVYQMHMRWRYLYSPFFSS